MRLYDFPSLRVRWRLPALALLGVIAGLGMVPWSLWWLSLPALALMMLLFAAPGGGRFSNGWAFGVGYFGLTLHWIYNPFLVDAATDGWMAPFAVFFMVAGFALFWGAALAIADRLRRGSMLMLVVIWAGVEMTRSLILTGFPWALIGHIWTETALAQLAAFVGPHGLTLLTLLAASALAQIGYSGRRRLWVPVPILLGAVAWIMLDPGPAPELTAAADTPLVRIVQPNAPQNEKWDPDRAPVFFNRMIDATGQPTETGQVPALVVWPETAIPYLLEWADPSFEVIADVARGAPVILGINRRDGSRYFNSLILLGRAGHVQAIYDKAHLVPFGEYTPFGEMLARLGISGLAASQGGGFSAGQKGEIIDVPGIGPALPLICYEGIFAEEVGAMFRRPRLMVLITNDAWFGQDAGPQQHLAQERLRAIEQGLPMVRSANTGISAMIDGKGRIVRQLGLGEAGFIDAALPPALSPTLYSRLGDWPVLVLLIFGLAGAILRRPKNVIDPAHAGP